MQYRIPHASMMEMFLAWAQSEAWQVSNEVRVVTLWRKTSPYCTYQGISQFYDVEFLRKTKYVWAIIANCAPEMFGFGSMWLLPPIMRKPLQIFFNTINVFFLLHILYLEVQAFDNNFHEDYWNIIDLYKIFMATMLEVMSLPPAQVLKTEALPISKY